MEKDREEQARKRRKEKLLKGGDHRIEYIKGLRDTPQAPAQPEAPPQQHQQPVVGVTRHAATYRRMGVMWALRSAFAKVAVVVALVAVWRAVMSHGVGVALLPVPHHGPLFWRVAIVQNTPLFPGDVAAFYSQSPPDFLRRVSVGVVTGVVPDSGKIKIRGLDVSTEKINGKVIVTVNVILFASILLSFVALVVFLLRF